MTRLYWRPDSSKSREKNIDDAQSKADEAKDILNDLNAALDRALRFSPPRPARGWRPSERRFEQSADGLLERLRSIVQWGAEAEEFYREQDRHAEAEKQRKAAEEEARQRALKKASDQATLKGEAVEFLLAWGKHINVDFTVDNALETANDIVFYEAVAEKVKAHEETGEFFDFDGQNCDGPCSGWDGSSRRCECGNRRVDWVRDEYLHSFKYPFIRAEAY